MSDSSQSKADVATWKAVVLKFQQPSLPRALWQMVNTLVPYAALWYLMYLSLPVSWWPECGSPNKSKYNN